MPKGFWILCAVAWLAAATAAFIHRDALAATQLGKLALIILGFPLALALYTLAEGLGEGVVFLLMVAAFKVATLGLIRTEFASSRTPAFPWHGFARDLDGRLVASHGCVYVIGAAVYVAAGVGGCLWRSQGMA